MEEQPSDKCPPITRTSVNRPQVKLHVKPETDGTDWTVGYDEDPSPQGSKVEVFLPQCTGAHEITFQLVGAGPDIKFDLEDPIWVREGRECPREPSKSTQIEVVRDRSGDRKLVISDKNEGAARVLTYQLNFIGAKPCDPMIRNGGEI